MNDKTIVINGREVDVNVEVLSLYHTKVTDLSPLANLKIY